MNNKAWHALFYSPDEHRLRAGWRLCVQIALMGFLLGFVLFAFAFVNTFFHWKISDTGLFILSTFFELIAFTGSVALARRFLDKRKFVDLGFLANWTENNTFIEDLFYGFLIAMSLMTFVFFIMIPLGWVRIISWGGQTAFSPLGISQLRQAGLYLGLFIIVGFQEELLCRGYHLQTIASGSNVVWGMVGSSIIFALLHLGNPGANWMATVGIFFAGLLLAFAYVRTGNLWLSIGLHIGWNFFEGVVFGFPTSGVAVYALTRIQVSGPVFWTGGAFGPEAGLIILPALAIGAMLVYLYSK
jgi:membrane protease YdiL (CAAX protease family)